MTPRRAPRRPTILVLSADGALRRRLRKILAKDGLDCREMRDPRELLEPGAASEADLLLVDLYGRGTNLAEIRKAFPSAPLIVLARAGQVAPALVRGATDCLLRPVQSALLLRRVKDALGHREALQELEHDRQEIVALCGQVAALRAQGEGTRRIANPDGLSGLPQREQFLGEVEEAIVAGHAGRDSLALLCVHLDPGGAVRTSGSAPAREEALAALSARLRESVRDRDTVGHLGSRMRDVRLGRIGTEEVGILLPGLTQPQDAGRIARRIQEGLARPLAIDGREVPVLSTWGIAVWPADGANAEALLEAARAARHSAHQDEPGGVRFFTAEMNATALQRLALETGLRRALDRDELVVHYQPLVELASGQICGFEALVRWKHPELGLVPPGQFIPIAEETGLIVPIGERVLASACAQNRAWQKRGMRPVRISVNVSSVQFRDPALPAVIERTLAEARLAPEFLELELTETGLMHRAESTIGRLHALAKMGVHLSIDDFGTGYSSLSYLKRFPMDALKIDQSFIREVTTRAEDAAITTSIVLMGKSLDLSVVAEGVETKSQLAFLRVIGCDQAQGYLFSRPLPAAEAGALLATGLPAHLAA